uniref:Uncharacterized protein n=1 Tax=Myoviridae sp. ctJ2i1 TaxID=2825079 RepID=A0A8S5V1L6_9CAUD|nr:MAG TPA: hypothetical protein [Myoviridae sp. ctJ2i1]
MSTCIFRISSSNLIDFVDIYNTLFSLRNIFTSFTIQSANNTIYIFTNNNLLSYRLFIL